MFYRGLRIGMCEEQNQIAPGTSRELCFGKHLHGIGFLPVDAMPRGRHPQSDLFAESWRPHYFRPANPRISDLVESVQRARHSAGVLAELHGCAAYRSWVPDHLTHRAPASGLQGPPPNHLWRKTVESDERFLLRRWKERLNLLVP